jgi:hypothetical protein
MVKKAAPSWSFCIRRAKVVHMKIGCGVTGASEMGRVACPEIEAQVADGRRRDQTDGPALSGQRRP